VDWGRRGRDSMVVGFTTLPMKSVHITIDVVSSNLDQGDVHNMLWLATGRWISPVPPVSSPNTTDRHEITEILLKEALDTIKQQTNNQANKQAIVDST